MGRDEIERSSAAREVVVDAAQHHRAAQARLAREQLLARQPVRADDAVVERAGPVGAAAPCRRTRRAGTSCRVSALPEVDADDVLRLERPARLLERLADDGVEQRFAVLEVAGRLIEHDAAADAFLDEQELAVALDDRGDRDVGCLWRHADD